MLPMLSARWEDTEEYDEASGQYFGRVVLEFGGHQVAWWPAPEPFEQTSEDYAAEVVAGRLGKLFTTLRGDA